MDLFKWKQRNRELYMGTTGEVMHDPQVIYRGTIVGYKKSIPLNGMETTRLRIQIEEY